MRPLVTIRSMPLLFIKVESHSRVTETCSKLSKQVSVALTHFNQRHLALRSARCYCILCLAYRRTISSGGAEYGIPKQHIIRDLIPDKFCDYVWTSPEQSIF